MSVNHACHHVGYFFQVHGGHSNSSSRRYCVPNAPLQKLVPELNQKSPIGRSCDVVQKYVLKNETLADAVASMHFPIGPWNNFEDAFNELQEYAKDITTPCDVDHFGSFELVMKGF